MFMIYGSLEIYPREKKYFSSFYDSAEKKKI
jgi:hypothetical protein